MVSPRVICVGEALLDRMVGSDPAANAESAVCFPGGAPANVACGLTKLGTPTAFLGCIGADDAGEKVIAKLNDRGVDVEAVSRRESTPTRVVEVGTEGGERKFLGFAGAAADSFADAQLQAGDLPESLFVNADYMVLGSNALAYPASGEAVARAVELANDYFIKILLDVNWRPMFWTDPDGAKDKVKALAQQVDFLKLSEDEAEWLYGTTDAARILGQVAQLEMVLITAGGNGTRYALASGLQGEVPAFRVAVQDTTGAGDAFVAGVMHQLATHGLQQLRDESAIIQALRYANAAGSLATTGMGAIAPQASDAEIQAFLVGRTT